MSLVVVLLRVARSSHRERIGVSLLPPRHETNVLTNLSLSLSQQQQRLLVQALGASNALIKLFCFFSSSSLLTSFKERRVFL